MSKTGEPIIKLKGVSKKYDEYGVVVNALYEVSLEIFPGELVSIIGPSGCGKSTLLHCMGLLDRPTSGKVYVDGRDTSKISGKEIALFRGEKLGFVFQNYNLIPRLTVLENVILPGLIMNRDPAELEKKARVLLEEVGIHHRADHKGVHLSGGEQQRVAIARALINDPVVVLADEPTGALDSDSSLELMELLVELNKNRGATTVFVSHDVEIAGFGRRTIALKDGRIVGDTREKGVDFKKVLKKLSTNSREE
ncbi:MAG: ABC transporter ATP-binding protein [Thermoplasmata archaeon]|nr:MAG: ABC transporter ATP-binding protein [Thermoplasmata archaeon]RLF35421.1 MAG: ABC transporter ATP-binding protein [Thermoplasmata archaeon]